MPSAVPMQMFFKQFHRGPVVQGSGMGRAAHPLYYSRRRVGLDSLIPKVLSNLNDSTKRCREGGGSTSTEALRMAGNFDPWLLKALGPDGFKVPSNPSR